MIYVENDEYLDGAYGIKLKKIAKQFENSIFYEDSDYSFPEEVSEMLVDILEYYEDDFIDVAYYEYKYAYEEGTINNTFMCRTDYDDTFNTTRFYNTSFELKPNIGTDNYTYIVTSCNITSTIDVSITYGKNFIEIIPEQFEQSGSGYVQVTNVKYKLIYETNMN